MSCSVSQIRMVDKVWVFCFLFFSWKRHDPVGNLGKHANDWPWNDLLGTHVMTVEMTVNWASDNVSSVLTNVSVCKLNFKTPIGDHCHHHHNHHPHRTLSLHCGACWTGPLLTARTEILTNCLRGVWLDITVISIQTHCHCVQVRVGLGHTWRPEQIRPTLLTWRASGYRRRHRY